MSGPLDRFFQRREPPPAPVVPPGQDQPPPAPDDDPPVPVAQPEVPPPPEPELAGLVRPAAPVTPAPSQQLPSQHDNDATAADDEDDDGASPRKRSRRVRRVVSDDSDDDSYQRATASTSTGTVRRVPPAISASMSSASPSPSISSTLAMSGTGRLSRVPDDGTFDPNEVRPIVELRRQKRQIPEHMQRAVVGHKWKAPTGFVWPSTTRLDVSKSGGTSVRKLNKQNFVKYDWLTYSVTENGLFCKYCVCFAPEDKRGINLGQLVNEPQTNYGNLTGRRGSLVMHSQADYHQAAVESAAAFMTRVANPEVAVTHLIDRKHEETRTKNRVVMKSIISSVNMLVRHGLPFRGHRDSGRVSSSATATPQSTDGEDDDDDANQDSPAYGIFRNLLTFRCDAGDVALASHLRQGAGNAMYTSPTIQNDLILCIGNHIRESRLKEIRSAGMFTIICDETTDISRTEQMSFNIRYVRSVQKDRGVQFRVEEDFLGYTPLTECTGLAIYNRIQTLCAEFGLDLSSTVGLGFDGAAAMSGAFRGVQGLFCLDYPAATYVHCNSHKLNLVLGKSCQLRVIQHATGIVSAIIDFFRRSPKNTLALEEAFTILFPGRPNELKQLLKLCETRWVERHDAIERFVELFRVVRFALEQIAFGVETDQKVRAKAGSYWKAIVRHDFVYALLSLNQVLSITKPLSVKLQKPTLDVASATELIDTTTERLNQLYRDQGGNISDQIYAQCLELAVEANRPARPRPAREPRSTAVEDSDAELSDFEGFDEVDDAFIPRSAVEDLMLPRTVDLTKTTARAYYKRHIYTPFVKSTVDEMRARLSAPASKLLRQFDFILPSTIVQQPSQLDREEQLAIETGLVDLYQKYRGLLPDDLTVNDLKEQYNLYRIAWQRRAGAGGVEVPQTGVDAMAKCPVDQKAIRILLQVFATLPVTSAVAERTFSILRFIKNYRRSMMADDRLSALAVCYIHKKNVNVDNELDEIIERFKTMGPRRFIL